jgi:hypothetical protein
VIPCEVKPCEVKPVRSEPSGFTMQEFEVYQAE